MDNKNYYDRYDWEKASLGEKIRDKILLIFKTIPQDVKTVIDIGCGDGTISNELNNKFDVTAIDRSFNALKYVKAKKIQASANLLPIKSNTTDLVFSSEMIEHLPEDIFISAISELKRISNRYIFLTFPHDENIEKQVTQCTKCKHNFNKSYHHRSLNIETIKKLFPEYKIITKFEYGLKIRDYNRTLSSLKHKFTPSTAWIPNFWTSNQKRNTMCPNCGHEFEIPYKFNLLAYSLDMLNILISKKRPYQLCVLLEKK